MIFIIRHGETDDNKNKCRQGWEQTALNSTGIRQCNSVRKWLADKSVDKIYSSDLYRAKQSAEIISNGKDVEYSEYLRERNWGYESKEEVRKRVNRFIKRIDNNENILIVTHGNTARHIISILSGCSTDEIVPFENCEVRWPTAIQKDIFGNDLLDQWKSYRPDPSI